VGKIIKGRGKDMENKDSQRKRKKYEEVREGNDSKRKSKGYGEVKGR
jgi:hypothetical protein